MKLEPTNKLFFNKYLYKLCLATEAGQYDEYCYLACELRKSNYPNTKIRCEGRRISVFTNDVTLLENLSIKYQKYLQKIYGPTTQEEIDFLSSNTKKILCDYFPYHRYQYRVYLKCNASHDLRARFRDWMMSDANRKSKIGISYSTFRWLSSGWYYQPFIYVEDSPMLTMVSMYLGDSIKRVEEFILRDQVNTTLEDIVEDASTEPTT